MGSESTNPNVAKELFHTLGHTHLCVYQSWDFPENSPGTSPFEMGTGTF